MHRTLKLFSLLPILFFSWNSASAHILVGVPDKFDGNEKEKINVVFGLAEPLLSLDLSKEKIIAKGYAGNPAVISLSGSVVYKDGTEKGLSTFTPINQKDASDKDVGNANADKAEFVLEKSGTAIIKARMDFNSNKLPTVTFAKTIINWSDDGQTGKILGDKDIVEIVLLDNPKPAKVGDTLKAQVFLRGQPLADAEISATYDGAPTHKDSEENDYLIAKTDKDGKVSFKMDQVNTWVIAIEYIDKDFESGNSAYEKGAGVRYRSSIVFRVQ